MHGVRPARAAGPRVAEGRTCARQREAVASGGEEVRAVRGAAGRDTADDVLHRLHRTRTVAGQRPPGALHSESLVCMVHMHVGVYNGPRFVVALQQEYGSGEIFMLWDAAAGKLEDRAWWAGGGSMEGMQSGQCRHRAGMMDRSPP